MGCNDESSFRLVGQSSRAKKTTRRPANHTHRFWPAYLHAHSALYTTTPGRSMGHQCAHDAVVEKALCSPLNPPKGGLGRLFRSNPCLLIFVSNQFYNSC